MGQLFLQEPHLRAHRDRPDSAKVCPSALTAAHSLGAMGESALYVLKGIEDMLQTEVKFFSMVRKEGERMCAAARPLGCGGLWPHGRGAMG